MGGYVQHVDVSKNTGTPKMDGENNGNPYEQMDDLGGFTIFLGWHPMCTYTWQFCHHDLFGMVGENVPLSKGYPHEV